MKAYWDILRELREDHDLTQAQGTALAALKASFFAPQPLVANFSTPLGGLFARLLIS